MMRSLDNERAKFAYNAVHAVVERKDNQRNKKYRSLVRSLPAIIQMQGLGAAIAFLYSKKEEAAFKDLYGSIGQWCKQQQLTNGDLVKQIVSLDMQSYRIVSEEVIQIVLWKKQFAEGMIENDKE